MKTSKAQRILLIDLGASMGGVEVYLEALSKVLSGEAELYALCVLEELEVRLAACGVRVVRIPAFARLRLLRFLVATVVMVYLLLRFRIEAIQINGFFESVLLAPARLLGRHAVYTRHGPFELDLYRWYRQPHRHLPRLLARYGAGMASRLVCVSETVGAVCRPLFPPGRVTVIPNWISRLPDPRTSSREARPVRILCVGRLEHYKGLHLLIEAAKDLDGVAVSIVGDGAYRAQLEALAGSSAIFAGFHRDPTPFYREADIFVMPSLGPEGLPMVALEAMAHGIACIFSDLPVHREITGDGQAALLFERGNAADLRSKLTTLMADEGQRKQFAERACHMVQCRYQEPVARKAYLELFATL